MTVAELMTILATKPPWARVVVLGFDETEYDDVGTVSEQPLTIGRSPIGHCGQHTDPKEGVEPDEIAILINF